MRSGRQSLTLLHLSDPQFGPNHREAQGGTEADRQHDTLQARLLQDLEELTHTGDVPRPELVMVTGDLSEHAKPSQFAAFERFAETLLAKLELPRERLVLVPGNHDVSWSGCQAYFHACAAEELEPEPPYWPKWRAYAGLLERWYAAGSPALITESRPYSLFVFEELCTVVAGLNSTMAETHRPNEHHGQVGEDQLRWFRDQLAPYRREGWLRIAAVHHNVQRNATDDDANLRDADDLQWLLADEINLVLHGHTHDGKLGWLRPEIPVVSTGAASVISGARPHGVPCQYQVLSVHQGRLRRWTRAYFESRKRFGGDVMASPRGDDWRHVHPVAFADLGAFGSAPPTDEPGASPAVGSTGAVDTAPSHTAIVLDRTKAWKALTTSMVEAAGPGVFVVYGTWHQDIQLFMRRIESYFNEQAASRHKISTVDPTHDGSRATTAEDWERATIQATDAKITPLSAALFDEAFGRSVLLLLSDRGPVRAASRKEQDAVVEFVVERLPTALQTKPPREHVRVVVPIELPEDGSTELVTRIQRGIDRASGVSFFEHHQLTLPDWPDIETSLQAHAKWSGVSLTDEQLDRCKARFEDIEAGLGAADKRMLFLGNQLHALYAELLLEAKQNHAASHS